MWPGLLLSLSSVLESPQCASYQCASTASPPAFLNSATCVFYNAPNNTYLSGSCKDHYMKYCDLQYMTNSTCSLMPEPVPLQSWPGEACLNDTSCLAGNCLGGVCYGQGFNETCWNDFDCSPGLFCNNTVCIFALSTNDPIDVCTSDFDCLNNAGCDNNICVPYMSLEAGTAVQTCSDFTNLLCQSTLCLTDSKSGASFCLDALTAKASGVVTCSSSQTCVSQTDASWKGTQPGVLYSACTCGYNPTGTSYCAPFPGDLAGQAYLTSLKAWVTSRAILRCNTRRRFNQECMQLHWDAFSFNQFTYAELNYNYFPALQNMDTCTKSLFLLDFYQAQARVTNGTQPSGAGMVALGVLVWLVGS